MLERDKRGTHYREESRVRDFEVFDHCVRIITLVRSEHIIAPSLSLQCFPTLCIKGRVLITLHHPPELPNLILPHSRRITHIIASSLSLEFSKRYYYASGFVFFNSLRLGAECF